MPIYLEFAPEGLISDKKDDEESEESEAEDKDKNEKEDREKTVFIKNLNFNSTEE
jgi:RNA recognition motif-containing protein